MVIIIIVITKIWQSQTTIKKQTKVSFNAAATDSNDKSLHHLTILISQIQTKAEAMMTIVVMYSKRKLRLTRIIMIVSIMYVYIHVQHSVYLYIYNTTTFDIFFYLITLLISLKSVPVWSVVMYDNNTYIFMTNHLPVLQTQIARLLHYYSPGNI